MKKYVPLILVLFIFSCGVNKKNESKQSFDKKSIVPKDTQTSAKDGGYGFEEIYKDLGYETYILPEEDYKYFGSTCLLYTSPSPRDATLSRMPSSA